MGKLDGKVALITGAARGQGRAHAETLARHGAEIIAVDIAHDMATIPYPLGTAEELAETAALVEKQDRRVLAIEGDVRSQEAMDEAVARGIEQFGHIDILIANQGVFSMAPHWEITDEMWYETIDACLTGTWRITKALMPHLIERQQGAIVMTASVNGIEPAYEYAHYNAAKAGVILFAKTVALEVGRHGIRCNVVCPGGIDTGIINWQGAYDRFAFEGANHDDLDRGMHHWTGLKHTGLLPPHATADAMAWLVSDEARYVTGTVIPVDGGHLNLPGFNGDPVWAG